MSANKTLGVLQQKLAGIAKVIAKLATEVVKETRVPTPKKARGTSETKAPAKARKAKSGGDKPKRTRRTKAEMAAFRAEQAEDKAGKPTPAPAAATIEAKPKRTRRSRAEMAALRAAEGGKPKRTRRTKAQIAADEAAEAAQADKDAEAGQQEEDTSQRAITETNLGDCLKCKYALTMGKGPGKRCSIKQIDITDPVAQAKNCDSAFYGLEV